MLSVTLTARGYTTEKGEVAEIKSRILSGGMVKIITPSHETHEITIVGRGEHFKEGYFTIYHDGKWKAERQKRPTYLAAYLSKHLDPYIKTYPISLIPEEAQKVEITPEQEAIEEAHRLVAQITKDLVEHRPVPTYSRFPHIPIEASIAEQMRILLMDKGPCLPWWIFPDTSAFWVPVIREVYNAKDRVILHLSPNGTAAGNSYEKAHATYHNAAKIAAYVQEKTGRGVLVHASPTDVYLLYPYHSSVVRTDHGSSYGYGTGYALHNWYFLLHEYTPPEGVTVEPVKFSYEEA